MTAPTVSPATFGSSPAVVIATSSDAVVVRADDVDRVIAEMRAAKEVA